MRRRSAWDVWWINWRTRSCAARKSSSVHLKRFDLRCTTWKYFAIKTTNLNVKWTWVPAFIFLHLPSAELRNHAWAAKSTETKWKRHDDEKFRGFCPLVIFRRGPNVHWQPLMTSAICVRLVAWRQHPLVLGVICKLIRDNVLHGWWHQTLLQTRNRWRCTMPPTLWPARRATIDVQFPQQLVQVLGANVRRWPLSNSYVVYVQHSFSGWRWIKGIGNAAGCSFVENYRETTGSTIVLSCFISFWTRQ